jgi:hypothetical protein
VSPLRPGMIRNWVPFQEEEVVTFRSLLLSYGPSLYWALDDTDLATDLSGNGRDGTASGVTIGGHTATFPPIDGEDPSCTEFDNTDDAVTSTYAPFTNGTTRTFLGWAWRDTSTSADVLVSGSGTYPNTTIIQGANGSQTVEFYNGAAATASWAAAWPGNAQWVFWAVVFNETTNDATLYINGSAVSTVSQTDAYDAAAGNYQIGRIAGGNNPFDGKMGHVAVLESGLTAQQVEDLYTASGT